MTNLKPQAENAIFCDLSVFTDAQRAQHTQLAHELFATVTEVQVGDDGYALRLSDNMHSILKAAEFINDDRRCCAFIHFGIEVEPYGKGIWLTLKGDEEVQAAIKAEMISLIPDAVAAQAGLR